MCWRVMSAGFALCGTGIRATAQPGGAWVREIQARYLARFPPLGQNSRRVAELAADRGRLLQVPDGYRAQAARYEAG